MTGKIVLGLDFGSDSVRALAVATDDGSELASAVAYYPRWAAGRYNDPARNQFRHHPQDYIDSMCQAVRETVAALSSAEKNQSSASASIQPARRPHRLTQKAVFGLAP